MLAHCVPHTNELPLRHLIERNDGPTSSSTGFTGLVGKLLAKIHEMAMNWAFSPAPVIKEFIQINPDVVAPMSSDARNSYRLVEAVTRGKLGPELAQIQCGTVCHSRWLNTGQRLVFMVTRHH